MRAVRGRRRSSRACTVARCRYRVGPFARRRPLPRHPLRSRYDRQRCRRWLAVCQDGRRPCIQVRGKGTGRCGERSAGRQRSDGRRDRLARSAPGEHPDHRFNREEARRAAFESDLDRRPSCEHVGGVHSDGPRRSGARWPPRFRSARHAAWRWRRVHLGLGLSRLVSAMGIAFVFPGQGSQSVGMMAGFEGHPIVRTTFDEASGVLGEGLWAVVTDGPEDALNQTVNTQPVMLTAGIAVWRAWQAAGGATPTIMAGHSLGEYTALVAARALAFGDAVPLVRFPPQVLKEAGPAGVGAMAAILGLDVENVAAACAEAAQGQVVEAVNFNTREQIVIAGHREAVERAIAIATEKGAKRGQLLPVSAPFHSSLMKPAAERLAARLATVSFVAPAIQVLQNVDAPPKSHPDAH